ncbi:type VII secretion system-associated protein [Streptomyces sp. NBC_01092]|nr:type VII secretion system-associated protein [Streptomyces sp. NBC_01092]
MHEAARLAPDHWIGMVDPAWRGNGAPPKWALVGWWRSGSTGEIEQWQENKDYRPSPQALGWPEPTDPVDAAVQLASTRYGPAEDVPRRLAVAEVAFLVESDGTPVCGTAPDHTPVLPVYTAPDHIKAVGRLLFEVRPVADLVELLPLGHQLYVNPTGAVSMLVETESLLSELDSRDGVDNEEGSSQAEASAESVAAAPGVGSTSEQADDAPAALPEEPTPGVRM